MKDFTQFLEEGVNDPGIFKAIFLAGGPGSGKSYVQRKTMPPSTGLKLINSDDVFELGMAKADLDLDPLSVMSPKGQEIRNNAKRLVTKRQKIYMQGRLGLIIDGTGKDVAKIKKQMTVLMSYGYDCYMVFVNTTEDVALDRNKERPRSLPDADVSKMWNDVQRNIGAFQNMFGNNNFIIVDNSSTNDKVTMSVWKELQKFIKQPVKNYIAKQWIDNMKSLAQRK
jgi:predicted kinase